MKKIALVLVAALISTALLASCSSYDKSGAMPAEGGSYNMSFADGNYGFAEDAEMFAPAPSMMRDHPEVEALYTNATSGAGVVPINSSAMETGLAEKIIYSVYADIETVNFDETVDRVYELMAANGAFVESSYVGGMNYAQSYHGWQTYRTANFTLRVPKDRLNAVTESLDALGNVTSKRSDAENITSQFFDTQSRLNSYKLQEDRLLDMLSRADNVPDMISIEQRLAEVRYSIESLTTTLNSWQQRVDYSTLTLYISEVESFTEITPVQQRTFWEQIGDGLEARTIGVGRFFMNLFKWITINLPVLIVLAVIAAVIIILVRRRVRKNRKLQEERAKAGPYQYYGQYQNQYAAPAATAGAGQGAASAASPGAAQGAGVGAAPSSAQSAEPAATPGAKPEAGENHNG